MEIRNNAEALKAFLGVTASASSHAHEVRNGEGDAAQGVLAGDQATLSHVATEMLEAAQPGVRADKVAAIQQALAAGTYQVPATAVAGKVMDAMLVGDLGPGK
jgi:flagellar biosynthesis anti-sigma factor FlgM